MENFFSLVFNNLIWFREVWNQKNWKYISLNYWYIKISKVKSIFWIIRLIGIIEIKFLTKIPNNVKIKCRIDKVQGRIISLISSIITIKFIKNT